MSGGGGRTVSRSGRPICAAAGSVLRLLEKSSHFTYEMVHPQGKAATDGGFKKPGHGCPCF